MRQEEITAIKEEKLYLVPSDYMLYLHCVYTKCGCVLLSVIYTGARGYTLISVYNI